MSDESTTAVEKFTVTLPDFNSIDDVAQFIVFLELNTSVHGVKRLLNRVHRYNLHVALANNFMQGIHSTANFINGVRSRDQKKGDDKRSLRSKAEAFYNTLSTPILRMQCTAFGLDYDSFETVEDVVRMLVDKTIEQSNH